MIYTVIKQQLLLVWRKKKEKRIQFKYCLIWNASSFITSSTRFRIESTSFLQFSDIFWSRNPIWITAWISFVFVGQSILWRTLTHRFSIGLRSGEFPGHWRHVIFLSLKYFIMALDMWHGAESYWNTAWPLASIFHSSVSNLCSDKSLYFCEFIMPSIGTRDPLPL